MSPHLPPLSLKPHVVLNTSVLDEHAIALPTIDLAMGCFWGAERAWWTTPGVYATAVGYCGGHAESPTYREVCSGATGHAETVRVVYDPATLGIDDLLARFFTLHDPTQVNRQGADVGTQYRSAIFTHDAATFARALAIAAAYNDTLRRSGWPPLATDINPPDDTRRLWWAEDYHQQYLAKNPDGYCGLRGTGVACVIGD